MTNNYDNDKFKDYQLAPLSELQTRTLSMSPDPYIKAVASDLIETDAGNIPNLQLANEIADLALADPDAATVALVEARLRSQGRCHED